jgi:hypothetical protein
MSNININTNTIILIILGLIIVVLIRQNIDNFADACSGLEASYVGNPVCGNAQFDNQWCRPDKNNCRIDTTYPHNPQRICKCKLSE